MVVVWLVQEIGVQENWKCASVETLKFRKTNEPKWWGTMTSPGGDMDPKIYEVMCLADIIRDDVDTCYVYHVSVSFEHADDLNVI
jgi:hypothetical protein